MPGDREKIVCNEILVGVAGLLTFFGMILIFVMCVGTVMHSSNYAFNYEELVKFNIVGISGLAAVGVGGVLSASGGYGMAASVMFGILLLLAGIYCIALFAGQGVGHGYNIYYYDVEGDGYYDPGTDNLFLWRADPDVHATDEFLGDVYKDGDIGVVHPNAEIVRVTTFEWNGFNMPSDGNVNTDMDPSFVKQCESRTIKYGASDIRAAREAARVAAQQAADAAAAGNADAVVGQPTDVIGGDPVVGEAGDPVVGEAGESVDGEAGESVDDTADSRRRLAGYTGSPVPCVPNDFQAFVTLLRDACRQPRRLMAIRMRNNEHLPVSIPLAGVFLVFGIFYALFKRCKGRNHRHDVRSSLTVTLRN